MTWPLKLITKWVNISLCDFGWFLHDIGKDGLGYRQGWWMDSRGAWTCFWSLRVWNIYQVFSIPYNVFHGILVSNFNSLEMQIHVWILMLFTSMRIWKTTWPLITLSTFINVGYMGKPHVWDFLKPMVNLIGWLDLHQTFVDKH
jgi:hypothetical protein